ncbi:MAG TPA: SGNH/GDSL hydrolase family protein [Polyangiaceae bacterium]|nr:SGNH/GDSL hydrolase family protein [Polyangiaceae bacterium]
MSLAIAASGCGDPASPGAGTAGGGGHDAAQAGSATMSQGGASAGATSGAGGKAGTSSTNGGGGASSGGQQSTAGMSGDGGATSFAGASGSGGQSSTGGVPPVVAAGVRWVGRVDVANAAGPRFAWSGSGFVATVTGDTVAVKLRVEGGEDPIYLQPVVDGVAQPRVSLKSSDADKTLTLGNALSAGDHVVELYRETEGKSGYAYCTFLGFASGTPKAPPAASGRLIEVIGDSISAGYGNLGSEEHPNGGADPSGGCHFTTETESAYKTYGAVAARAVQADVSIVAASGWGIYSDNSGNKSNVLPAVFGNTVGGLATPAWSFAAQPQAVVINLGTNDFSADMNLGAAPFSDAYNAFIATVRGKYPDAVIYCAIGPMLYSTGLTNATKYIKDLVAAQNSAGDKKVKVLDFGSQDSTKGTGCDYHPNVAEDQRMATLLTQELKTTLGW